MPYSTILAFLVFGLSQTACASTDVSEIIKSNFEPLISDSLPIQERRQSITVAIVTPKETEMFFLGELSDAGGKPNELTVFEIGSLTKGYLGLLIAKASIDGKIELDGPISDKFQPLKSKMQPITWRQLANQTSGFPRLPSNLNAVDPLQPYRDYDLPDMLSYLSKYNSTAEPGKTHDYSNFGAGVAGAALSELYGKPLNEIFTEMIAKPNHLTDTTIFLEDHQQQRQAPVFLNDQKVKPWKWLPSSSLQGAAALKSTISNSVNMMKTMLAIHGGDSVPYIDLATTPSFEITPVRKIGLFWNYSVGPNIIWHNGGTAGSSSFFGYDPDSLVGIVVLSNSLIIKDGALDPRLDIAAFKALNALKAELGSSKALALLKRYDVEVARQNDKFKQLKGDLNDAKWVKAKLTHMYDVDQYMRSYSSSDEV